MRILIKQIDSSPVRLDRRKLARFRELLRLDSEPPPISVALASDRWTLVDGSHRLAAARAEGRRYIEAELAQPRGLRPTKDDFL